MLSATQYLLLPPHDPPRGPPDLSIPRATAVRAPRRSPDTVLMAERCFKGSAIGRPRTSYFASPNESPSQPLPAPCIHVYKVVATLIALCILVPRVSDFKVQLLCHHGLPGNISQGIRSFWRFFHIGQFGGHYDHVTTSVCLVFSTRTQTPRQSRLCFLLFFFFL